MATDKEGFPITEVDILNRVREKSLLPSDMESAKECTAYTGTGSLLSGLLLGGLAMRAFSKSSRMFRTAAFLTTSLVSFSSISLILYGYCVNKWKNDVISGKIKISNREKAVEQLKEMGMPVIPASLDTPLPWNQVINHELPKPPTPGVQPLPSVNPIVPPPQPVKPFNPFSNQYQLPPISSTNQPPVGPKPPVNYVPTQQPQTQPMQMPSPVPPMVQNPPTHVPVSPPQVPVQPQQYYPPQYNPQQYNPQQYNPQYQQQWNQPPQQPQPYGRYNQPHQPPPPPQYYYPPNYYQQMPPQPYSAAPVPVYSHPNAVLPQAGQNRVVPNYPQVVYPTPTNFNAPVPSVVNSGDASSVLADGNQSSFPSDLSANNVTPQSSTNTENNNQTNSE
eukprot:TRINITY_DN211_c0_g1_i1.p2 TRINITY_DN211_c0_g1~~TRINITY_DN211_c0_g1_i1.p2  ORF type:complete len:390 (-),score=141.81 TRINITY_DN211_c0_g1_i1:42-1211(-)